MARHPAARNPGTVLLSRRTVSHPVSCKTKKCCRCWTFSGHFLGQVLRVSVRQRFRELRLFAWRPEERSSTDTGSVVWQLARKVGRDTPRICVARTDAIMRAALYFLLSALHRLRTLRPLSMAVTQGSRDPGRTIRWVLGAHRTMRWFRWVQYNSRKRGHRGR